MSHLTRDDYAAALRLIETLEPAAGDALRFAREAAAALGGFVACELTTLSVCDLVTGRRRVVGLAGERLAATAVEGVDRRFGEQPSPRRHGPDRAVAVPLHTDGRTLVSFVLSRCGADFGERDRARLELLRPHLAFLYAQACRAGAASGATPATAPRPSAPDASPARLTPREGDVMRWLALGKTDAGIAAMLGISPRTVHKHLEHIYVKLGVETRTAAVMRALAAGRPDGRPLVDEAVETGSRGGR